MSKYHIIVIEREYASGGREVGEKVAKKLQIPCYGQEILEMVAQRSGRSIQELEHLEESATNSLLYSLYVMGKFPGDSTGLPRTDILSMEESKIIHQLIQSGSCVLIGHCAGWVLRERSDVLRVFIHASHEYRQQRAMGYYHISPKEVDSTLRRFDRRRANYYRANTKRAWDDQSAYHMMLSSSELGIDTCVDIIAQVCQRNDQ